MSNTSILALVSPLLVGTAAIGQEPDVLSPPTPLGPGPAIVPEVLPGAGELPAFAGPHGPAILDAARPFMQSGPVQPSVCFADFDYILWFFPSRRTATPLAAKEIGQNPNITLGNLVDDQVERHLVSGMRMTFGYWMVEQNDWLPGYMLPTCGAELSFLFVGERSVGFRNETAPTIVRPFFDVNNHAPSGVVVAAPGFATGAVAADASMDMWGSELNFRNHLYHNYPGTVCVVDMLVGARYLNVNTAIATGRNSLYNQDLSAFPGFKSFEGNRIFEQESFLTHNHFFGGQLGINARIATGRLVFDSYAKLALGMNFEEVAINGFQVRTLANGQSTVSPGALLALPSNIGRFNANKFSQVPELGLKVAYPILDNVTLSTGFTAMYWNRIVRAGDQIDRVIDVTQIPNFPPGAGAIPTGMNHPAAHLNQTDLWLLGLTFGVEVKW